MHFKQGDARDFARFVESVSDRTEGGRTGKVLFHLFNDTAKREVTDAAISALIDIMPGANYVGCSTSGNICDGVFVNGETPNLTAVANVFEDESTRMEVHQFPLDKENRIETAKAIYQLVDERPWVKAVEMLTTLIDVGMADFCDYAQYLRDDVAVFGGGALSSETVNMWAGLPYVFSSAGENSGRSIVIVLYGGKRFNVQTQAVHGWKPLGRPMTIGRSDGPILHELDGAPAFDRFRHYLSIDDDEDFSKNCIIFPLAFDHFGHTIIKAPVNVDEDGSITLTSDLASYHKKCRIAYGDPGTILRSIRESARLIQEFEPQGILAYSCAARRMYWGDDDISRETMPLESVAPTAGFYTGGEFLRSDGVLLHHNVTLVVVAFREGMATGKPSEPVVINETEFTRQMGIVNSLASFVGVTSSELEEAYAKLEVMATTDWLTSVFNRREIESRISQALVSHENGETSIAPSLVMIDIDDFKKVNDKYGHKAGDDVLRGVGELLRSLADENGLGVSGRWGGEEFMVLLPSAPTDVVHYFANELCEEFSKMEFPLSGKHTASVGIAQAMKGESLDSLCQRVDKALYAAKEQGKNRVVVA